MGITFRYITMGFVNFTRKLGCVIVFLTLFVKNRTISVPLFNRVVFDEIQELLSALEHLLLLVPDQIDTNFHRLLKGNRNDGRGCGKVSFIKE